MATIMGSIPPATTASLPVSNRMELAHHRLYEFAKKALINIFVPPYASVCDLYCGGGADTDKWDEAQIGHYVGVDTSSSGITEAREIWESQRKPYTAEFCVLDPSVENLGSHLQDKGIPVDIVCCLQHLQLCFEREERVRTLLHNVSSLLEPGGYFFGITPDSSTIWTKYQKIVETSHNKGSGLKAVQNCIRSDNYAITFEVEEEKFPFFGKKYMLKFANDIVSETHCLVHFPSLIRLARESGLDYVEIQNLAEFYDDNRSQFAGMLSSYGPNFLDPRGKLLARSFDILGLYSIFIFQKSDPDAAPPLSPMLQDEEPQEWHGSGWMQPPAVAEDDKSGHAEASSSHGCVLVPQEKGILGPGPPDLRFSEPF